MTSKDPAADSNANNEGEKPAFENNPIVKSNRPKCKKPIPVKKAGKAKVSRGKLDPAELIDKFKDEDDELWEQIQEVWNDMEEAD